MTGKFLHDEICSKDKEEESTNQSNTKEPKMRHITHARRATTPTKMYSLSTLVFSEASTR